MLEFSPRWLAGVIDPAEVDDALTGYQAASDGPMRRGSNPAD